MTIELPELPYALDALAPHISEETLKFHYGKHHKGYVDKTNNKIAGTRLEKADLEEAIFESEGRDQGLFNVAAQAWNHDFYWKSMNPKGGGAPKGEIAKMINSSFGSYDEFKSKFVEEGAGLFGSGWLWLARDGKALKIVPTENAGTLLTSKSKPLLVMDVWEHAYYIDVRNERAKYVAAFLDHLIDWSFAEENLAD